MRRNCDGAASIAASFWHYAACDGASGAYPWLRRRNTVEIAQDLNWRIPYLDISFMPPHPVDIPPLPTMRSIGYA
jgi:hypothetical protein